MKRKYSTIISIDEEKVFDKIQHPIIIKTLSKTEIEKTFLSLIKNIYKNIKLTVNGEKLDAFPLR